MTTAASLKKMLTVEDVAAALGYAPYTIRQWARDGALPGARRMGGRWRFNAEKIQAYIDRAGGRSR